MDVFPAVTGPLMASPVEFVSCRVGVPPAALSAPSCAILLPAWVRTKESALPDSVAAVIDPAVCVTVPKLVMLGIPGTTMVLSTAVSPTAVPETVPASVIGPWLPIVSAPVEVMDPACWLNASLDCTLMLPAARLPPACTIGPSTVGDDGRGMSADVSSIVPAVIRPASVSPDWLARLKSPPLWKSPAVATREVTSTDPALPVSVLAAIKPDPVVATGPATLSVNVLFGACSCPGSVTPPDRTLSVVSPVNDKPVKVSACEFVSVTGPLFSVSIVVIAFAGCASVSAPVVPVSVPATIVPAPDWLVSPLESSSSVPRAVIWPAVCVSVPPSDFSVMAGAFRFPATVIAALV